MTLVTTLPFPSGRILAGWWKQLAGLEPQGWWVGHLFVHRVEAAVAVEEGHALAPLHHLILQSLALAGPSPEGLPAPIPLPELTARLRLSGALLGQILRQQMRKGWLEEVPRGFRLTEAGRAALSEGKEHAPARRRQVFSFLERRDLAGSRLADPCFLPLAPTPLARPWSLGAAFPFDPAWLKECVAREFSWKQSHGFPVQVKSFLAPDSPNGQEDDLPGWQKIVVDRLEEVTLTLVRPCKEPASILGFAARPSDWHLDAGQAVLNCPGAALPPLQENASSEVCRQAWTAWASLRNLPHSDVDACRLTLDRLILRVQAPGHLVDLLRQAKSDVLKGESWVLLGDGFLRQAARLEVKAAS